MTCPGVEKIARLLKDGALRAFDVPARARQVHMRVFGGEGARIPYTAAVFLPNDRAAVRNGHGRP
jgi:hypothetical protein